MSMFLSKCESCGFTIVTNSVCTNCSHSSVKDGTEEDTVNEFSQRRETHNRNSKIWMLINFVGGFFALLAATSPIWRRILRSVRRARNRMSECGDDVGASFVSYEALPIVGVVIVVIVFVAIMHLKYLEDPESFFPVALCCPKCDERLDQLNIDYRQCPACTVLLQ